MAIKIQLYLQARKPIIDILKYQEELLDQVVKEIGLLYFSFEGIFISCNLLNYSVILVLKSNFRKN